MIHIRNLLNINTTKSPIELGYTNHACITNTIELNIYISEINNPYIEFTLIDNSTTNTDILEIVKNEISYVIPDSYYSTTGTLKLRVKGDDYESEYIAFNIKNDFTSEDEVCVKIENNNYIIRKIRKYKISDLPIATKTSLGAIIVGDNLEIDSDGVLSASGGGTTDLSNYYTKTETENLIDNKIDEIPEVDLSNYYNKTETETVIDEKINEIPETDLSNYYTKEETEAVIDEKIEAIPEVDLSDYYKKSEAETMVDEKIEEIPVSDLLHYKGHLASVDNLPSAGQPSAPEVAPVLSVGTLKSTWTISDFNITKFKELLGSYKYLIGSGGLNMSSSLLTRARIFFNSSSVLDGCCPISDSYLVLHFNASATQPVYVYGTTDIKTIYYDDGTTQDTTTTLTTITKPFWTRLTLNSTVGSSVIYTVNNLDFDIRLKFPPTSLGFLSEEYVTFKSTTLNRYYIEGYYLLTPVGLTASTTGWFNYYAGEPSAEAVENNFYTVGDNYDIYVCDSSPAWKLWSESEKVDLSNYYTKDETDTAIDNKIAEIPEVDLSNYYNKEEVDELIENESGTSGDSVPIGSIFYYDGDTVPEGYEEISNHSTNEQIVGTWIDGTPIYRKVVELTSPSSSEETNILTLSDISTLKSIEGTIINENNMQVQFPYIFGNTNFGMLWYNTSDKSIYCLTTDTTYQNKPMTIILEYMKTMFLEEEANIVLNDILSADEDTETVIDMTEEEMNETLDYIIGD